MDKENTEELPRLGMDEKSFRAHHRYIASLCDIDRGRVLEVMEISHAALVLEWFHIFKHLNDGVNRVRAAEYRALMKKITRMLKEYFENIVTLVKGSDHRRGERGPQQPHPKHQVSRLGFHRFENYRIIFFCGKLDPSPFDASH